MFSPYYARARRRAPGGQANPLDHCAVNVALYRLQGGTPCPSRWAMTERGRGHLARSADALHIGPSSMQRDGDALVVHIDETTAPWPSRLQGSVRVTPASVAGLGFALDARGLHRWCPLAPVAHVEVRMAHPGLSWRGTGYMDSNEGDAPLEDHFTHWQWSRAALPGRRCAVHYDVQRRDGTSATLALHFDARGDCSAMALPPQVPLAPAGWGIERAARCDPASRPTVARTLEDGPFYARSLVRTHLQGMPVTALHESLSLQRFGQRWVQWLLPFRMPRRA